MSKNLQQVTISHIQVHIRKVVEKEMDNREPNKKSDSIGAIAKWVAANFTVNEDSKELLLTI